mmetsp:Transcript_99604/g.257383  ORF Transcript_99604/g.257383 Transcript_99604/m.257383 type:complete len:225 (+) Transcript_99604:168-842(+)
MACQDQAASSRSLPLMLTLQGLHGLPGQVELPEEPDEDPRVKRSILLLRLAQGPRCPVARRHLLVHGLAKERVGQGGEAEAVKGLLDGDVLLARALLRRQVLDVNMRVESELGPLEAWQLRDHLHILGAPKAQLGDHLVREQFGQEIAQDGASAQDHQVHEEHVPARGQLQEREAAGAARLGVQPYDLCSTQLLEGIRQLIGSGEVLDCDRIGHLEVAVAACPF